MKDLDCTLCGSSYRWVCYSSRLILLERNHQVIQLIEPFPPRFDRTDENSGVEADLETTDSHHLFVTDKREIIADLCVAEIASRFNKGSMNTHGQALRLE